MDKNKKRQLLTGTLLVLEIIILMLFLNARINTLLDSDMASEMILGQFLAQNNTLFSTRFYYSTEMRVLSIQIVFTLLFKLFSNWHFIRMAAMAILWAILIASYYFLCRQLGCRKYFLLTLLIVFAPVSDDYFEFMLAAACYVPYVAIAFSMLALNELYMKAQPGRKKLWLVVSALLALVAGLGGPREIIALYGPVGIVAVLEWLADRKNVQRIRQFFYAAVIGGASLIGYLLNVLVLARFFHFGTWVGWFGFELADGERLTKIFSSFFSLFGAGGTGLTYGFTFTLSVIMILLTAGCILYAYTHPVSDGYRRLAGYTITAYLVYILLYVLTNMPLNPRYGLLYTIMSVPLFACALNEIRWDKHWKTGLTCALLAATAVACVLLLVRTAGTDETADQRDITAYLLADGYQNGYATFWNANILTELSGGQIEVWDWGDEVSEHDADVDGMYQWLQKVSHSTEHPSGKVFVLFTRDEFEDNPWKENLYPEDIIYENETYFLLGYPDYDTMKATLEKGL